MLPEKDSKQSRGEMPPSRARVMLVGTPKVGKTTLTSMWKPDSTLLIDTHNGTKLLDGNHYVQHIKDAKEFENAVNELIAGGHHYETVVIDLVDDLWNFFDKAYAGKDAPLASATDDWQRSIKTAEGMFRDVVGKLLSSDMGVWFVSHAKEKEVEKKTRFATKLDQRVLTYVQGAVDFIFLAEKLNLDRLLHTQPTDKFEAGSRVAMPEPLPLDPKVLWAAMDRGLNPEKYAKKDAAKADNNTTRETVTA